MEEQQHRDQLDAAGPHLEDANQFGEGVEVGKRAHRPHPAQTRANVADEGPRRGKGHYQVFFGKQQHHRAQHEDEEVEHDEGRDRAQYVFADRFVAQP